MGTIGRKFFKFGPGAKGVTSDVSKETTSKTRHGHNGVQPSEDARKQEKEGRVSNGDDPGPSALIRFP